MSQDARSAAINHAISRLADYTGPGSSAVLRAAAELDALVAENEYLRVRMLVAVSFMDSGTYDKFTEHTAGIDAKHKEASRV